MESKSSIRKKMKESLSALPKKLHEQYSNEIAERLFKHPLWKQSNTIGITISSYPEVDTLNIIRKAWDENKRVVVPKCYPKTREMKFRLIHDFSNLESVYSGLQEPIEEKTTELKPSEIDFLIVPGLAYTKEGYRLGFGGGYYDRYLEKYEGETLSLAFSIQIVPFLPMENHDKTISTIISNEEVHENYL